MSWVACQTKLSYKYRRRTHTVTPSLEESYLRVDISCGSEACDSCRVGSGSGAPTASLSASAPYYLIPDGAALADLLELFELPDISNYIILSSCLRQVSLHSGRKATRLRALYRDRRRRAVLFDDLHCLDTAVAAAGGDEALPSALAAGLYYSRHLGGRVPLVVVSDRLAGWTAAATAVGGNGGDGGLPGGAATASALADNLAEAMAAGVTVLSAAEYISRCWTPGSAVAELFDSLTAAKLAAAATSAAAAGGSGGDASYEPHLSQQEVETALAAGQLMRGVVHVSRRSPTEAVVELGHGPDAVLGRLVRVSGRGPLNRAMEGDVVAVRLLHTGGPPPTAAAAAAATAEAEADADAAGAAAGVSAADNAAAADADYGAELLADAEGQGAGGEEGALAMMDTSASECLPAAEVVAILQRDPRDIVACLSQRDEVALKARLEQQQQQGSAGGPQRRSEVLVCLPLDRRLPAVVVVTRQGVQLVGSRFVVRVDSWERNSRFPRGHVTRVLGRLNDLRAESEAVLVQCGIHHKPFCEAALLELPRVMRAEDWQVPVSERAARRDLTGPEYFVVSIDPVGCTDVDDAMHVRFLPTDPTGHSLRNPDPDPNLDPDPDLDSGQEQLVEVGVHIADVSWFVAAGGMLDGEARDRCTSVYLVDRRLDMLPGLLSEQLCSLRQGVERLAVSVVWTLRRRQQQQQQLDGGSGSPRGRHMGEYEYDVEDVWFGRTIIRSRHQLHYQQAQDVLDERRPAPGDELRADHVGRLRKALRVLDELAGFLHAGRVAAGALELASAELRFRVDEATGAPCQVVCKQKVAMMDVVAEMMIAANSAVAERIAGAYPSCALLRNHPPPRAQAFEQVRSLLEPHSGGVQVDPASNASLAAALERACAAAAASDPAAATLIKSLATRAMSEAQYNSSGTTPPATPLSYHYGLALQYYTHFTSPIRRYADVVVHRQLLAALSGCPPPQLHPDLAAAAHNMNVRHRQAKAAQKECSELYLLLLLHARPHVERALVCGISATRLELFIPSYHLRGAVPLADRRGLPRLPLRPGQTDGPEVEEDAFAAAERRGLRLATTPEEATITDTATGVVVWSARLWQPVSVRLSAAGHRAHGPKLAMRLLDSSHPDALPPAPTPVTAPAPNPVVVIMPGAAGAGGAAPILAAAGGAAGGGGPSPAPALPPHLRLLISIRDTGRADLGGGCSGAAVWPEAAAGATARLPPLQRQQGAAQGAVSSVAGPGPGAPAADAAAGGDGSKPGQARGRRAGLRQGREQHGAGEDNDDSGGGGRYGGGGGGEAVLAAPSDVLAASVSAEGMVAARPSVPVVSEVGCMWLEDGQVMGFGQLPELRSQMRRTSRLEMRLLACRRGSAQERKLRERLDELNASVRHLQA